MKQNLILILADQLRYDVLGKGYTPNLDLLAGESVCFDNAYCASPLCVPARGSLFTGLCPNSTGSRINPWEEEDAVHGNVRAGIDHLYDMMERGGWNCIHSGKQHLFTEGGKLEDRPGTRTKWLATEQTYKEFLKENEKRAPGGARFRAPVPEMAGRRRTIYTTCSNADTGCYEEGEGFYFDGYFADEAIRGLRERDSEKPLFLSTMFLAPHRLFQKMCMYQESVKVPLFIKLPRRSVPGRISRNVSHVDVLPTLCDYLGIVPKGEMEGISLRKEIEGTERGQDLPVFIQYDGNSCLSGFQRAVIQGGYKLILDVFQNERWLELYHIEEDAQEKRNLLMENQEQPLARRLLSLLCGHMAETGDELARDVSWLQENIDSWHGK